MTPGYTDQQLRLAARLYYVENLAQAEVAKLVNVSQAKVSRLLALARQQGIVRISVSEYEARNGKLEKSLRNKFGLSEAVVINEVEGTRPAEARHLVGHLAAPVIAALIPAGSTVAISGGRVMRHLVDALPDSQDKSLCVVQAMGSVDSTAGPVDAQELARNLSARLGGTFFTLSTPAFVPDGTTRDAFLRLAQIQRIYRMFADTNVALVGIGTLENSVFSERWILSPADVLALKSTGAVGEICGRFYRANGQECVSAWKERVIGIELKQLRKVPQVIGVVCGADRKEAAAAAIRGGILKSLVLDESLARALLSDH